MDPENAVNAIHELSFKKMVAFKFGTAPILILPIGRTVNKIVELNGRGYTRQSNRLSQKVKLRNPTMNHGIDGIPDNQWVRIF